MKNSIIYLGITLMAFTNVITASNVRQSFNMNDVSSTTNKTVSVETAHAKDVFIVASNGNQLSQEIAFPVEDTTILNLEAVLFNTAEKTMEEIIAEDNKITETTISNEVYFLSIGKTMEEIIAEDNSITESTISNEVHFLQIRKTVEEVIAEDDKITESSNSNEVYILQIEKTMEDVIAEDNKITESTISNEVQSLNR
jgi:Ni,Fe-hydrogenase III component G